MTAERACAMLVRLRNVGNVFEADVELTRRI